MVAELTGNIRKNLLMQLKNHETHEKHEIQRSDVSLVPLGQTHHSIPCAQRTSFESEQYPNFVWLVYFVVNPD